VGTSNSQSPFGYATGDGGFNPRPHGYVTVSGVLPGKVIILLHRGVNICAINLPSFFGITRGAGMHYYDTVFVFVKESGRYLIAL
jgi:hypothetical protein